MLEGFEEVAGADGATAWVSREYRDALGRALLEEEGLTPLNEEGRGEVYLFPLADGQGVFRRHLRGGFVRHFMKRSYLMDNRPRRELETHVEIWRRQLPVPEPLGAVWRSNGPLYCGALATRYLEGVSLEFFLRQDIEDDGTILRGVGETIARFHEEGVYHADLNIHNILLSEGKTYLIDFDKAEIGGAKNLPRGVKGLDRLARSFSKHGCAREAYKTIMQAYANHLGVGERLAPLLERIP